MLAEGLPPAATTFSVASVPASIAATAERDNDASKRVLAFINETSWTDASSFSCGARRERRVSATGGGQTGCRGSAVPSGCARLLLTSALASVVGDRPVRRDGKG